MIMMVNNKKSPPWCRRRRYWPMLPTLLSSLMAILLFLALPNGHCLRVDHDDVGDENSDIQNSLTATGGDWSPWSLWSSCSRICDGGIATSVRQCLSKNGCLGNHKRHKLCNMQPCLTKVNFRQMQCSAYNNKPYRDRYYEWLAYTDPTDPCSLTCQARGWNFVAKLAPQITDGTRCAPDSLDVCVAGKCLSVGCDLQLGSLKRVDDCGVCGGNGSSCRNHFYTWSHRFLSGCSRSCGGGFQSSTVVCFNGNTDQIVDEIFCQKTLKPEPITKSCNEYDCQPSWVTGLWTACTRKCGIGLQTRTVDCVVETKNGFKNKMPDKHCQMAGQKPDVEQKCNVHDCPQWYEGPWSQCSENCGSGTQWRQVACKDGAGFSSDECDVSLKPAEKRPCSDISNCLLNGKNSQEDSPAIDNGGDSFLLAAAAISTEPHFEVGQWSVCNVTCGVGYKKRRVECKIYLEFSQSFITIPAYQCPKPKPSELEICYDFKCNLNDDGGSVQKYGVTANEVVPPAAMTAVEKNQNDQDPDSLPRYSWRVTGFTKCSATCLGGTQESIIECVRDNGGNLRMPNHYCDAGVKPETYTRICNDQPCVPRWNASDFGVCSKSCGDGGLQTRLVRCVHEVARGPNNFVVVPDHQCPGPKPGTRQKCNQVDCPARWIVDPWQKCSKDCGGGLKKRNIHCVKECSGKKPKISKLCNLKPCHGSSAVAAGPVPHSNEVVRKSKRNHLTLSSSSMPKFAHHKQTFKVQGKVTVTEGSHLKLVCPEWNRQSTVQWLKGHDPAMLSRRFHGTENVLKIRNVKITDTGVYKCIYDHDHNRMHSMFLHVVDKNNSKPEPQRQYGGGSGSVFYYQNELDVSKEMEKHSLKSEIIGGSEWRRHFSDHEKSPRHPTTATTTMSMAANKMKQKQQPPIIIKPYNSEEDFNEIPNHLATDADANGLFKPENGELETKYHWLTTEWSNCTLSCGGSGFRIRYSQCYAKIGNNLTRIVDASYCIEATGQQKPNDYETCGTESCFQHSKDDHHAIVGQSTKLLTMVDKSNQSKNFTNDATAMADVRLPCSASRNTTDTEHLNDEEENCSKRQS